MKIGSIRQNVQSTASLCIIVVLFAIGSAGPVATYGQSTTPVDSPEVAEAQRLLRSVLAEQMRRFNELNSIEYSMSRKLVSGPDEKRFSVSYSLLEGTGGRFRCEWLQENADGTSLDQSGTYDGESYQIVTGTNTTAFVAEGLPTPSRLQLTADEFFLSPYWFFFSSPKSFNYFGGPSLDFLKSSEAVPSVLKTLTSVSKEMFEGIEVCRAEFFCQEDRWGMHGLRRVVRLRLTDGFPLVIETVAEGTGAILSRYTVTEVGTVKDQLTGLDIPYPAKARGEYYTDGSQANDGKLVLTAAYEYELTDCRINNDASEVFSFDMSRADQIYDESSKVLITIPK